MLELYLKLYEARSVNFEAIGNAHGVGREVNQKGGDHLQGEARAQDAPVDAGAVLRHREDQAENHSDAQDTLQPIHRSLLAAEGRATLGPFDHGWQGAMPGVVAGGSAREGPVRDEGPGQRSSGPFAGGGSAQVVGVLGGTIGGRRRAARQPFWKIAQRHWLGIQKTLQ